MSKKLSESIDIVVAGHLCVDIYPDLSAYGPGEFLNRLNPGKLLYVGNATFATGGPVSNTGLALKKLGVDVCLMGKIGGDAFGTTIKDVINRHGEGLAKDLILSQYEGSSYTIIFNPPETDRMFLHFPGTNDTFKADDIDYSVVSMSKIFHFGYPPLMQKMYQDDGENLKEVMARAKKAQTLTSLDMALPDPKSEAGNANWKKILHLTLPYVDVFLPSFEEILFVLDKPLFTELMDRSHQGNLIPLIEPEYLSRLADELIDMGVGVAGIKLGDRGFYVKTADEKRMIAIAKQVPIHVGQWENREIWAPCFMVNLKGTTGSGDCTIAGFLVSLLKGLDINESMQMSVAVGACSVETLDSASGIRPWEAICERIRNGWERQQMLIENKQWQPVLQYHHWERKHGS